MMHITAYAIMVAPMYSYSIMYVKYNYYASRIPFNLRTYLIRITSTVTTVAVMRRRPMIIGTRMAATEVVPTGGGLVESAVVYMQGKER